MLFRSHSTHTQAHTHRHIHTHANAHTHNTRTHIHTNMCKHTHTYTYANTHKHTHTHTCHTRTHVHIRKHTHTHTTCREPALTRPLPAQGAETDSAFILRPQLLLPQEEHPPLTAGLYRTRILTTRAPQSVPTQAPSTATPSQPLYPPLTATTNCLKGLASRTSSLNTLSLVGATTRCCLTSCPWLLGS